MKKYSVEGYQLELPDEHKLDLYQKEHRMYDRFLPFLSRALAGKKGVIYDIGANVGDTVCAIRRDTMNRIIAIEGSEYFFEMLKTNIEANFSEQEREEIILTNKMIGSGVFDGVLEEYDGSARLNLSSETTSVFTALDSIASLNHEALLIKSDTDGFDFDVLNSAMKTIEKDQPVLFFENEIIKEEFKEEFIKVYKKLKSLKYDTIYLFDNFGNVLMKTSSFDALESLNSYIETMNNGKSTRTFYFCDVLCCTAKHKEKVDEAVESYLYKFTQ